MLARYFVHFSIVRCTEKAWDVSCGEQLNVPNVSPLGGTREASAATGGIESTFRNLHLEFGFDTELCS